MSAEKNHIYSAAEKESNGIALRSSFRSVKNRTAIIKRRLNKEDVVNKKIRTTCLCAQIVFVFLFAFIVCAENAHGKEDENKEIKAIVEKLVAYYAAAQSYEATFVQTNAHKMFPGRLQRAYGKVMFYKGGLMRWEYERPEKKFFIYDGKKLWVYEPEVPQIFSGTADAERLKKALAFLTGEGKIIEEYSVRKLNASKLGFSKGIVIGLWPNDKNSAFKKVELYLDGKTHRVVRSVVVDHEGNRNRLDFHNPKLGQQLDKKAFTFNPPPGVPVITREEHF